MNPFKQNNELLPVASINSVYVDDETAYNLFRPQLILDEIIEHKDELGITFSPSDTSLLSTFNALLNHELDSIKTTARLIAYKYGNRLAKVLSTLLKPSLKSISNRTNWTKDHWDYWKTINHIYIVGGLTSPHLTSIFYECIEQEFKTHKIQDITVTFIEGSQNLGTQGLSNLISDGDYLLFDFGQTSIKRRRHSKQDNVLQIDTILEPVASKYLFYKTSTKEELEHTARNLHQFIISTIIMTMNEVGYEGNNIYMSIANYVSNGAIYEARGGYGKLHYIAPNYQEYLSHELSKLLGRTITLTLFHDTSAMGLMFQDEQHVAVISLGTAFGVAFPE